MSQHPAIDQIIRALRRHQLDEAQRILDQARQDPSFDINARNMVGETIVHLFATPDRIPELRWLKAAGVDMNALDRKGETPLMLAVQSSNPKLVQALLDAGADPNISNNRKIAPLMQAVLNHKENGITEILLNGGAHPDPVAESGSTPLLAAASRGRSHLVARLLEAGANPEACDAMGQGLLMAAVLSMDNEDGAAAVLSVIKDKSPVPLDPNAPARSGTTPMAAAIGQPEAIAVLMEMGGDPNVKLSNRFMDGVTLLHSVVRNVPADLPIKKQEYDSSAGNLNPMIGNGVGIGVSPPSGPSPIEELAKGMMEKGADPTIRNDAGHNAGYYSLSNPNMLGALVEKGLDPKRPLSPDGATPFDVLVGLGSQLDMDAAKNWVDAVISHGFGFDRIPWDESIDGIKPVEPPRAKGEAAPVSHPVLHRMVAAGQYELAWYCISKGANPDVRNEEGETLAHLLVRTATGLTANEKKAISMIRAAKNVDVEESVRQIKEIKVAARERLDDLRQAATRAGVKWDAMDNNGNTPLHLAATLGNLNWVRWLTHNSGVPLGQRNDEGLTIAGVALRAGHAEMTYALVQFAKDRRKDLRTDLLVDTVLASSDDSRERRLWLNAVEALHPYFKWSEKDIQPSTRDEEKRDPVFLAASTEMDDVLRILLRYGGNPNARDENGNTALMASVFTKNGEAIRQLRAMGCDPDLKNNAGQTAFDVALWMKSVYLHNMLANPTGLDEVRAEVMGTDKEITDQQKAEIEEDTQWFHGYLEKVVEYFYQKVTSEELEEYPETRPMLIRAKEEAKRKHEEQLAAIAAKAASPSSPSTLQIDGISIDPSSPAPSSKRPGP